jgi:hypothetical protein
MKKIIEINGVKLEVDLREATTIESYKIGDNVKVLIKDYSDKYMSYPGVIIGFDDFKEMPTMIVAYLKIEYASAEIKFVHINSGSEGVEMCPANIEELHFDRSFVVEKLDAEITKKQMEVSDLVAKKKYFETKFQKYFSKK